MYLKKALRGTVIAAFFTMLAIIFSYSFRVILARNLTVAEYGLFYAIFSFFSLCTIFNDIGLSQSVSKKIVELKVKKNWLKIKSLLIYVLIFQTIIAAIIFLLLFLSSKSITFNILHTTDTYAFILMGIWFLTLPIPAFFYNLFVGFQKPGISSTLEFFRQGIALLLSTIFLYFNFGSKSPFLAYACINFLMLIIYWPFIVKIFPDFFKIRKSPDITLLMSVFKYGAYIAVGAIMSLILTQTDTIMLSYFKGLEAVGIYQAAIPIANFITYSITIISIVAYPLFSELYIRKQYTKLRQGIDLIYKYVVLLSIPIIIIIMIFSETIIGIFFGEKYVIAANTLRILSIAMLLAVITSINNMILSAIGLAKEVAVNMIYGVIINILLNIILIPYYGTIGAAITTAISFGITTIISIIKIKNKLKITIPLKNWIITIILGGVVFILATYLKSFNYINTIIGATIILIACAISYVSLTILFKIVTFKEIKDLIKITTK